MNDGEREIIKRFAAGDRTLRLTAIGIFRNQLDECRRNGVPLPRGDLHFDFMSEVDSPCPDYGLRAMYRDQLIAKT